MFNYNENAMNEILSMINKNIEQMSNMEDGYLNKMDSISQSGLYGNGIQMIDSQIVSIKDGLTDFRNITKNNSAAIEETEKRLKNDVDKIELPKNFNADDVGIHVSVSSTNLSKNDGLSINKNNQINETIADTNYDIEKATIQKLVKDTIKEMSFEDYLKTKQINLKNIEKENVKTSEIEDLKEAKDVNLYNINNNKDLNTSELDEYKETERTLFNKVKNENLLDNSIFELDFDDYLIQKYSILEKGLLEEIIRGEKNDHKS